MEQVSGNNGNETAPDFREQYARTRAHEGESKDAASGFLRQYAHAREGEPKNAAPEFLQSIKGAEPDTGAARQANRARLSQWRGGLTARGCARLEVTIGKSLIEQTRAYAKSKGLKLWEVVEEALELLVIGNTTGAK